MDLKIIEKNGQLLVDSREVAQMVGKEHKHLLRDIKNYIEILTKSNFGLSEFFIESTYKDDTGRTLPCYFLTKKGCDMVANKMTGEKGVLFTATYVTKFEEMEQSLKNPFIGLSKELQAIFAVDRRTQEIEGRVEKLENNMTIDYGQQLELSITANKNIVSILGGKGSPAYKDSSLRNKVYSLHWTDFKEYFQVNSYKNTLRKDFDRAIDYLKLWRPQGKLLREIEIANDQLQWPED
jgi:Rha family phage regulatory protein